MGHTVIRALPSPQSYIIRVVTSKAQAQYDAQSSTFDKSLTAFYDKLAPINPNIQSQQKDLSDSTNKNYDKSSKQMSDLSKVCELRL